MTGPGGARLLAGGPVAADIRAGLAARLADLGPGATAGQLAGQLGELAADPGVHGIILQTPLPAGVRADGLTPLIPPGKDVDGASPLSAGRLLAGLPAFAPATAAAVLKLLDAYEVPLRPGQTRGSISYGPSASLSRSCLAGSLLPWP